MHNEVVAKLVSIVFDDDHDGYLVTFWVGQEFSEEGGLNEAFAILGKMDTLQRELYTMLIRYEGDEYLMEPDESLSTSLIVFDQHETCDGMDATVRRQWKTGQVAEALCTQLIHANAFGVWRTGEQAPDEEESEGSVPH